MKKKLCALAWAAVLYVLTFLPVSCKKKKHHQQQQQEIRRR